MSRTRILIYCAVLATVISVMKVAGGAPSGRLITFQGLVESVLVRDDMQGCKMLKVGYAPVAGSDDKLTCRQLVSLRDPVFSSDAGPLIGFVKVRNIDVFPLDVKSGFTQMDVNNLTS